LLIVHYFMKEGVSKVLSQIFTPKSPSLAPPKRLREGEGGLIEYQIVSHPPLGGLGVKKQLLRHPLQL